MDFYVPQSCVDSLNRSRTETMLPFKNAMVAHPELVSVACDCLSKLSEFKVDHLVKQVSSRKCAI